MLGGFNITTARNYLADRYRLQSASLDSALMLGMTMEPAARLGSEGDAKELLDDVVTNYAASSWILLLGPAAGGAAAGAATRASGGMMMGLAAIDVLTKDQRALLKQQLGSLALYLKMDLRSGEKAFVRSKEASKLLQAQISLWNVEHGDTTPPVSNYPSPR